MIHATAPPRISLAAWAALAILSIATIVLGLRQHCNGPRSAEPAVHVEVPADASRDAVAMGHAVDGVRIR